MKELHLVTGSSGFLGQRTIERLLARNLAVRAIDINEDPDLNASVEFHLGDVRDAEFMKRMMSDVTVVHHHAALVPLTRAYNEFWAVNVEGARVVAEAAKNSAVRYFIHTSSSAVFGKTGSAAIDSKTPLAPIEPYGKSKLAGEQAVLKTLEGTKVNLAIIRPRTILGDKRGGIFELFFKWIENDLPIFTVGNGNNRFQFVHIDDLISAYFTVMDAGATGQFNVGTENFGTLNEVFSHLIQHSKSKSRIVHLPIWLTVNGLNLLEKLNLSPLAPWHYKTFHFPFFFDLGPLKELGWHSTYSNDELFIAAYNNYVENKDERHDQSLSPHRKTLDAKALAFIQKFFVKNR